jgi:RNA polymerase sigma factor (sigma-70 family)
LDIEKIIKECKGNVQQSQRALFDFFYEDMAKIVMRYCPNPDDAKEVLNDGFYSVFSNIGAFKGDSKFKTWMTTIFIRQAIKKINSNKTFPTLMEVSVNDNFDFGIADYDNALVKLETKELVNIIEGLPKFEKIVFNLHVFEGYKHREIAEICNFSEGTSRWYLNCAKKNIKCTYTKLNHISSR